MDGATKSTRDLAILLLDYERGEGDGLTELTHAVESAFMKLCLHLSRRMGSAGYRALLTRSLALAAADAPWVAAIRAASDGTMEGFAEAAKPQSVSDAFEGAVVMTACFIGLLDTFVGRDLSMRLLGAVWPAAIQFDQDSAKDSSNG